MSEAAAAIKRRRDELGWGVRRLARASGVSAPYISQIENGQRPATARVVGELAEAMGVPRYKLLTEAGFIRQTAADEAEAMAKRALDVPSIVASAYGQEPEKRYEWLVADYLYLLGYDPYGDGYDMGPGGNHADWRPLAPDSPAPFSDLLKENLTLRQAVRAAGAKKPAQIEGWDELTDSDRRLIQQLVNKLRRAAADDE